MLQCNCSILGDPETREALVVDPGDEVDHLQLRSGTAHGTRHCRTHAASIMFQCLRKPC